MIDLLRGALGLLFFLFLGWLCSENRRSVPWRVIGVGLALQFVAAVLILYLPLGRHVFVLANDAVLTLLNQARVGSEFVFGALAKPAGEPGSLGFILAFQVLPTAIFFASLTAILYHIGLLPWLVRLFARLFERSLGISGVESITAASNIFVGIESTLTIQPYLRTVPRHEFAVILTAGMATIASTVLGIYVAVLSPVFPNIAGHLLTANFLSAPAAILFARLLVPAVKTQAEGAVPREVTMTFERKANWVQSITEGAMEGFKLSCGIAAVLVAFMGLLGVVNVLVGGMGGWVGYPEFNLQTLLGWFFTPLAWLMGVEPQDSGRVGELLGLRLVTAELPAYFKLADWMAGPEPLGTRSMVITVYALCGFAHIPSLGIFVGGLTALAPERASDIGSVAIRSLIAATLACLMTGAIAGMLCGGNPAALVAR